MDGMDKRYRRQKMLIANDNVCRMSAEAGSNQVAEEDERRSAAARWTSSTGMSRMQV